MLSSGVRTTRVRVLALNHLDAAGGDILAFTVFPKAIWRQIWLNNPVRHEASLDRGEVGDLPHWVVAAA